MSGSLLKRSALWRFIGNLRVIPNGCWEWTAAVNGSGYGSFDRQMAHRWVYAHFYGSIAGGLDVDHLCRNRLCCNPAHLEAVTRSRNVNRAVTDICRNGHTRTVTNTRIWMTGRGKTGRYCLDCRAMHGRRDRRSKPITEAELHHGA